MSVGLLLGIVLVGVMALKLVDTLQGGHYSCPICGSRDQGLHSPHCPWNKSR